MTGSIQKLYNAWLQGHASEAERQELMRLLALPENKELALALISQAIESDELNAADGPVLSSDRLDLLLQSIVSVDAVQEPPASVAGSPVRFLRRPWLRYAAAVLLLLGLGAFYYFFLSPAGKKGTPPVDLASIAPGRDRAVLTLSNGNTILLDSAGSGTLAQEGDVLISKTENGAIVYDAHAENDGEVMMNTMTTPRGGQYQLTLPDGTRVWLNAASSIRFPAAFVGDKRVVEMTGEAYFEVKKDKSRPFYVRINNQAEVEVTGTSFNINAYDDEPNINTTLVEGSVNMWAGLQEKGKSGEVSLVPGQQGRMSHTTSSAIAVSKGDVEKATAWKNGSFNFEGSSLKDAMRQLARWYDIEVVYDEGLLKKGIQHSTLVGGISRDLRLADVLEVLSVLGLHFRMEEGRRLVLLP